MTHDFEDMMATIFAGAVFFVSIILAAVGLLYALDYDLAITTALVALYGVVQMSRTCVNNPLQSVRGWWFIFWFHNEWYKLVLLLTGMKLWFAVI